MEKKTSQYLKYALGEILLVVIGILIALQINNWNEARKQEKELLTIYERILLDLENDLGELQTALGFWKAREPVFQKVISDSITPDLLDQGLTRLLTYNTITNLNKTGVLQLKAMNSRNALSTQIIETYDYMEGVDITPLEKEINDLSKDLVTKFQENYDWFPEYMGKTIMKDNSSASLQSYFLTSPEYRNAVIRGYQNIFRNYVTNLETYIPILIKLRNELKRKIDPGFRILNREALEQFAGTYMVSEAAGADFGFQKGQSFQLEAQDQTLLFTIADSSQPTVFLYGGEDTFLFDYPRIKARFVFERDASGAITHLQATIETAKGEIETFSASRQLNPN